MANYLERVASSAGRRAAIAKPPSSGPPLLPGGRDLPLPAEGLFPSDVDQSLEASSHEPSRPEERAEIKPAAPVEAPRPSRTTDDLHPGGEPEAKPRAAQESLSSEPPFTVHLPKTLRPVSASKVPPPVAHEQPPPRVPSPAATAAGPRLSGSEVTHSAEVDTTAPPVETKAPDADRDPERQPPAPQPPQMTPIKTEATMSETLPVPRVDTEDGPHVRSDSVEPSPRASSPVHLPPVVAGSAARQEQSRITIGSLEVMVNNHPPVTPMRPPAATALRSEQLNLEKRYLDRFRLRH